MEDLVGKQALVTGGGSGIGASIAEMLAKRGAHVIVNDIDEDAAREVASKIQGTILVSDVGLPNSEGLVGQLANRTMAIDILINNAGFQHIASIDALSLRFGIKQYKSC